MGRATQTIRKTRKITVKAKKGGSSGGRMVCNMCGGTGYQKKPTRRKRKP